MPSSPSASRIVATQLVLTFISLFLCVQAARRRWLIDALDTEADANTISRRQDYNRNVPHQSNLLIADSHQLSDVLRGGPPSGPSTPSNFAVPRPHDHQLNYNDCHDIHHPKGLNFLAADGANSRDNSYDLRTGGVNDHHHNNNNNEHTTTDAVHNHIGANPVKAADCQKASDVDDSGAGDRYNTMKYCQNFMTVGDMTA